MIDEDDFWSNWWNEDWQRKPKYSEKTCPSATLSIPLTLTVDIKEKWWVLERNQNFHPPDAYVSGIDLEFQHYVRNNIMSFYVF
jgi:hypothetical protein